MKRSYLDIILFFPILLVGICEIYDLYQKFSYFGIGKLFLVVIVFSFFYKQKKIQKSFQLQNEQFTEKISRLQAIIEQCPSSIVITNIKGNIEYVNPMFSKVTGYSREEVMGKNPRFLKSGETSQEEYRTLWKTIHSGKQWYGQFHNRKKNQELYWELASISPILNAKGHVTHFFAIKQDITELKKIQEDLVNAKQTADLANKAKSIFLANMSHEIRTPMNSIIGMADLLWETPLNQDQKQYVQIFRNAGENLLNLINDILDLSKIEAGHCHLETIEFDLAQMIEQISQVMALKAQKKGLELLFHIANDTPVKLLGDPLRLRQILINLIGNAIKFTEKGKILVRICPNPQSTMPGNLLFSVSDTGIGISKDKQNRIFENFMQADSFVGRRYGGTGLGLSISKKIVELMKGRIWVESEENHGSVFSFTAQFGISEMASIQAASQKLPVIANIGLSEEGGRKILLVEDSPDNQVLMRAYFKNLPYILDIAENGQVALERFRNSSYDLILMDIQMPVMDGHTATKEIRKYEAEKNLPQTPVIALTAYALREEMEKCMEYGCNAHLSKPIKKAELIATIEKYLKKTKESS